MTGTRGRARRLAVWLAAVMVAPATALVAIVASAPPAAAATCSGDAVTKLTLAPANAVAAVGDSHTVTATETCEGTAGGADDTIAFKVTGTNPQTAEGVTDAQGAVTYSYYDDNGAGTDNITACTTALATNVCVRATVHWQCDSGFFENAAGCSRIPAIDFGRSSLDSVPGLGGGLPVGALPVGLNPSGAGLTDSLSGLRDRAGFSNVDSTDNRGASGSRSSSDDSAA